MPIVNISQKKDIPTTVDGALTWAAEQLKLVRLKNEYAGPLVEVGDKIIRFPAEVKDETRPNSLRDVFAADPTAVINDWKVSDMAYVDMTAELLQEVKMSGFAHINSCFTVERVKLDQLLALAAENNLQGIIAYVESGQLETGWPA